MFRKTICFILITTSMLLTVGCNNEPDISAQKNSLKSLAEIRLETNKISDLDEKFENLNLSKTYFYVPEVDEIPGFSIVYDISTLEREKLLLDTAEWFGNEAADENNMIYRPFDGDDIPFSECKNNPDRGNNYFMYYKNESIDLGINIGGNYIYAANSEADKFPSRNEITPHFIDTNQDYPNEEYNLLAGEGTDISVEVQNGEEKIADAVEFMKTRLENSPLNINELKLIPNRARTYKVGDRLGINIVYSYEYNGVLLDYHTYGKDLIDGDNKNDNRKANMKFDASMVWVNSFDQLYGVEICKVKPTEKSDKSFVSLESFLTSISEKLTGRSIFTIDSVELLYGLDRIFPEEYYTLSTPEETFGINPLRLDAHPMWVAYLSGTGISNAPQMCISADAVTGELQMHSSAPRI